MINIFCMQVLSLQSHLEERRGTEAWNNCQEKVVDVMKKTLGESYALKAFAAFS